MTQTAAPIVFETLETVMPDGVVLRADVARPAGSQETPVPVLLARCPYLGGWRPAFADAFGWRMDEPGQMARVIKLQAGVDLEEVVAAGFGVIVQACRGTDRSEGTFRFYTDEADDGVATRQAVADLPWCDGTVLTFGASYLSMTQFIAALVSTEHLVAMNTWVAPSTYDEDLMMRGGVLIEGPTYEWARHRVREGRMAGGLEDVPAELLPADVPGYTALLTRVGIRSAAEALASAHPVGVHVLDAVDHPLHDSHWESMSYPAQGLRRLGAQLPVLSVAGWYDLFLGGTLRNHELLSSGPTPAAGPHRLLIGPWTHINQTGDQPGRSFPHGGLENADATALHLDFWRAACGDADAAARLPELPVRVYIMGADRWLDLPAWPAPGARDSRWHLASEDDGVLLPPGQPAPSDPGSTTWVHDPAHPVPTAGGQVFMGMPDSSGPHDQRPVEARDDVVSFTTAPLGEPVTVLGPVRLRTWVSADATDAHLHAALTEVRPDGSSVLLTDGVLRLSARHGADRMDPLVPGKVVEVEVDMWATGIEVPAGGRLRLNLSGSCWPRYSVARPRGEEPVALSIHHDDAHPSHLVLPLIDPATA